MPEQLIDLSSCYKAFLGCCAHLELLPSRLDKDPQSVSTGSICCKIDVVIYLKCAQRQASELVPRRALWKPRSSGLEMLSTCRYQKLSLFFKKNCKHKPRSPVAANLLLPRRAGHESSQSNAQLLLELHHDRPPSTEGHGNVSRRISITL